MLLILGSFYTGSSCFGLVFPSFGCFCVSFFCSSHLFGFFLHALLFFFCFEPLTTLLSKACSTRTWFPAASPSFSSVSVLDWTADEAAGPQRRAKQRSAKALRTAMAVAGRPRLPM